VRRVVALPRRARSIGDAVDCRTEIDAPLQQRLPDRPLHGAGENA
jgi:hypothetical protein